MSKSTSLYNKYLLFIAGLGGLLYGIDVGVIAGALPYLQATTDYTPGQLSTVVAAVLLGSVLSSLFAGALSDLFGRKKVMLLAGVCFVLSVPVICSPFGFEALVLGRILQGAAAGLIGVVVPLYLAECLTADKRGFGTGMFQFMLTVGLVFAALAGIVCAEYVDGVVSASYATVKEQADAIFAAKDFAWRAIFWICAIPGVIFTIGACFISESARWLYGKGKTEAALKALERSRGLEQAKKELEEMGSDSSADDSKKEDADKPKDSLIQKKYIIPFVLAVVILACNQATGINSVLAYIVDVLAQAGLDGSVANQGDLVVKILNMVMTVVAMVLVDRKGRKFLLTVGTSGIIIGLLGVAFLFLKSERDMVNYTDKLNSEAYNRVIVENVINEKTGLEERDASGKVLTKNVEYAFYATVTPQEIKALTQAETFVPSQVKIVYTVNGEMSVKTIVVREDTPVTNLEFKVPAAEGQSFEIKSLEIGPLPSAANGWLVTFFFAIFIAAYAVGPGVCVWLALSELMPNRIRAMGMSIALLINQGVSTVIAGTFLPVVGNFGYSTIFFFCAACTVIYWITAVFVLPETKGRTLEEIEAHFEGKKKL